MIAIKVCMKVTNEPLKRTPVVLQVDADGSETEPVLTDRAGVARFELPATSGKILVSGVERYHGRLDGEILVDLWSMTEPGNESVGMPGEFPAGSNAYPGMTTRVVRVGERDVLTDGEGYLVDPADWSEGFARAQAALEGLDLHAEHWEVLRFLRDHYAKRGIQVTVREMIRHFRQVWGAEKGTNGYLHKLFPCGGPQKQGNRLACFGPRVNIESMRRGMVGLVRQCSTPTRSVPLGGTGARSGGGTAGGVLGRALEWRIGPYGMESACQSPPSRLRPAVAKGVPTA